MTCCQDDDLDKDAHQSSPTKRNRRKDSQVLPASPEEKDDEEAVMSSADQHPQSRNDKHKDNASSDGCLASEVDSPSKKKKRSKHSKRSTYKSKLNDGLTAEERALDDPTDDDEAKNGTPSQSQKGKRKASNINNLNPKSRGTPGPKTPDAFTSYEAYASKRDEG